MTTLRTDRLILREWRDDDLEPFAAMSRDPEVMAFYPALLTRDQSDAVVGRIRAHFRREGFGFWALEADGELLGFTGLARPGFTAHFTPCVEIGWRLARAHWGRGYAHEAACAALDHAFGALSLDEVVAFLVPSNVRSARLCARLGMVPDGEFDHPQITPGAISVGGFPLQRHALYRIQRVGTRGKMPTWQWPDR